MTAPQPASENLVDINVWHVDHHAIEGEPAGLGCGSAGSSQLDETDGRKLREGIHTANGDSHRPYAV